MSLLCRYHAAIWNVLRASSCMLTKHQYGDAGGMRIFHLTAHQVVIPFSLTLISMGQQVALAQGRWLQRASFVLEVAVKRFITLEIQLAPFFSPCLTLQSAPSAAQRIVQQSASPWRRRWVEMPASDR